MPANEGGPSTWSVDHLFLDREGVPVVVEVKRSSDSRIRREVVGQMLDYAANGVRYWPVADLRATFEAGAVETGGGDQELLERLGVPDPEAFWKQVEENLARGRVRLVFVADKLPPELVRIIEFLNEQMSPAEVLGVELPQYVDDAGTQVLVPRVIGRTAAAQEGKSRGTGRAWSQPALVAAVEARHGAPAAGFFQQLIDHAAQHGARLSWGRGASGGFSGHYSIAGQSRAVWTANGGTTDDWKSPTLYFYLPELRSLLSDERFAAGVAAVEAIPGWGPQFAAAKRRDFKSAYPNLQITPSFLSDPASLQALFVSIESLIDDELRSDPPL